MIFTRIYRLFREDESLVNEMLFEFLEKLLYAMKMTAERIEEESDALSKGRS